MTSPSVPRTVATDTRRPSWLDNEPSARGAVWPPRSPRLPADDFYERLLTHISVPFSVEHATSLWTEAARRRVADAVRPHISDVDTFICGSYSAKTYLATEAWDVDIVVRLKDPHHGWDDPTRAIEDLHSWLSHAIDAEFEATGRGVRITSADAPAVDVLPCWRAPGRTAGLICPGPGALRHIDPIGHRDLLAARDASLGTESGFLNVIRLVKHLNQIWGDEYGAPPLTAFHIEALALAHCTRPFNLAEEVAEFMAAAAELVWTPLPDPLGVAGSIVAWDVDLASALLTEAARSAEAALMTCDVQTADDILSSLFEPQAI